MKRNARYITLTEAARRLGVTRPTIYAMLQREEIRAERIGERMFVLTGSVAAWIAASPRKLHVPQTPQPADG